MTGWDPRPGFVRRYLRRGWWLFAVAAVICGIGGLGGLAGAGDPVTDSVAEGRRLPAVVQNVQDHGSYIVVRYEHPIFGPKVAVPELGGDPPALRESDQVEVVASRFDPDDVALVGGTYGQRDGQWLWAVPPPVTLLLALRRRHQVRLTEKSLTSLDPPANLLARLRRPRWRRRRVVADLHPLEAPAGASPLCSVPLISSGGLPIGAAPFAVRASNGRPGPWRPVQLRTEDDELLWPRRRALGPLALPPGFRGPVAEMPAAPLPQDLRPPRRALGWWAWCYRSLGLFLPSAAIFVLVLVVTNAGEREAEEFARENVEVPAKIVTVNDATDEVVIAYRLDGEELPTETAVSVNFSESWYVGQLRLAVVDPESGEALLLGDLYDSDTPIGLVLFLLIPATAWAVRELQFLFRQRRRCRGPWYQAQVLDGRRVSIRPPLTTGLKLTLGRPGAPGASCAVVVAVRGGEDELRSLTHQPTYDAPWWQAHQPAPQQSPRDPEATSPLEPPLPQPPQPTSMPYQTFRMAPRRYAGPVLVSGILAPGETVVLRIGDVVLPAIRLASAPKWTQPVPLEETRVAALSVPPVPRSV